MNTKKLLGKRIKELIKNSGIKQEKMAELIGIEPTALSNIVTGRNYPLFTTLEKIINVLNINFLEVFDFNHLENEDDLKKQIIDILDKNPKRLQDFYKILVALTK